MNAILLLLVVFAIVYFFGKSNKTIRRRPIIHFNSRKHFAVIIGYVVFLLAVLVTAEIVERQHQPLSLTVDFTELNYELVISESVHSPRFTEKRTHPASDILNIQNDYGGAFLYIKRKSNNDGIIEELIFKPMLLVNGYDFSHKVNMTKPIWRDGLIAIPEQPMTEIRYAQFYDTLLLNQITDFRYSSSSNFSTGQPIVYLIVPENVEIKTSSESSVEYVTD